VKRAATDTPGMNFQACLSILLPPRTNPAFLSSLGVRIQTFTSIHIYRGSRTYFYEGFYKVIREAFISLSVSQPQAMLRISRAFTAAAKLPQLPT